MTNSKSDLSALFDSFNSQASTYEHRTGGSNRRVVAYAVPMLTGLPKSPTLLDNACGPGYATVELLKAYPNARIHAVDVAPEMISIVDKVVASNNWNDRVETAVMNAMSLDFADETFDASITNLGIFFFPDPIMGAREIYRTLKPGGKAVVTCWKEVPLLPIMHAIQAIVKPRSVPIAFPTLDQWTQKETIETTLREGGFETTKTYEKEVMWWNNGLDEAAKGFADKFKSMIGDQWTEVEKGHILNATIQVLKEQGNEFIVESEGMIGSQQVAWIVIATKKDKTGL